MIDNVPVKFAAVLNRVDVDGRYSGLTPKLFDQTTGPAKASYHRACHGFEADEKAPNRVYYQMH